MTDKLDIYQNIIFPTTLSSEVHVDGVEETFSMHPIQKGYGVTIGNSLRRILLSSIRGVAVSFIRTRGLESEYSTIDGIVEDVLAILINLKKLSVRMNQSSAVLTLNIKKSGVVTAKNIQCPADIEITNPDLHICTSLGSREVTIEIGVEEGIGMKEVDPSQSVADTVFVDRFFSPIDRVSFAISNAIAGDSVDNDRLDITIRTNGSITPKDALGHAAYISRQFMSLCVDFEEKNIVQKEEGSMSSVSDIDLTQIFNKRVSDLELSVRSNNCLSNEDIYYIGQLVQRSEMDIIRTPNFGRKSLDEIKSVLSDIGLSFDMDVGSWKVPSEDDISSDHVMKEFEGKKLRGAKVK